MNSVLTTPSVPSVSDHRPLRTIFTFRNWFPFHQQRHILNVLCPVLRSRPAQQGIASAASQWWGKFVYGRDEKTFEAS